VTLLTIVQNAQDLISGMARTSTVVGNTDPTVRQLLALANEAGRTLVEAHAWTVLITLRTRTTVAAEEQTSFLPSDFDRFVDESMWNVTRRLRVRGPLTPQQYSATKSLGTIGAVNPWFRKRGSAILLFPTPSAGETITYEFVSKQFAAIDSGGFRTFWGADTDTGVIDERLFTLAIVWMWLARKGLDFSTEAAQYEAALRKAIAADGGRETLDMTGGMHNYNDGPGRTTYVPWLI